MQGNVKGDCPLRFPMFVDLSRHKAVVFGGGPVAARRARTLTAFCAQVTVIAPDVCAALETLDVRLLRRPYAPGDCAGCGVAVAATDSRQVNRAIFLEARREGVPVNVSDAPEECDFFFPAVAQRGPVVIGVTASGADHALAAETAKRLRENLDALVPWKEAVHGEA